MSRLRLALGLLAGLTIPAQAQNMPGRDSIPTRSALARLGLERQWSTVVPLASVDERVVGANIDHGTLYVQTNRGHVHAVDGETGRRIWSQQLAQGPTSVQDITSNSDQTFIALQDRLHCVDRASGHPIWSVRLEGMPSTGVVADEEVAGLGLRTGKLVAYNTRDHSKDKISGRSAGTFARAFQTGGIPHSAPILTPKVTIFGSADNRVYAAIRANDRGQPSLLYRFLTQGPITGHLGAVGNRTVVIPCEDFNVYAIDLFSGEVRWIVPTGAPVSGRPQVAGTDVIVLNDEGRLVIIDARTGTIRAEAQTGSRSIRAVSPTRIYLGTVDNNLEIIDRASGQLVASDRDTVQRAGLTIRELNVPVENSENDRLYFVSPEGILYCVREIDSLQPTPLRDPKKPPFGTVPPRGFQSNIDEELIVLPPMDDVDEPGNADSTTTPATIDDADDAGQP